MDDIQTGFKIKTNEIKKAVVEFFREQDLGNLEEELTKHEIHTEVMKVIQDRQQELQFAQWCRTKPNDTLVIHYFPDCSFDPFDNDETSTQLEDLLDNPDVERLDFHNPIEFLTFLRDEYEPSEVLLSSDDANTLFDKHTSNLESMVKCCQFTRMTIHKAKKTKEELVSRTTKRVEDVLAGNVVMEKMKDSYLKASTMEYLEECKVSFYYISSLSY